MKYNKIIPIIIITIFTLNLVHLLVPRNAQAQVTGCLTLKSTLRIGSKDANTIGEVSKLQNFLYTKGYMSIGATGYFGNVTDKAVKSFQAKENISAIGIVGPATRARIATVSCVPSLPEQPVVTAPTPAPVVEAPSTPTTLKLPYYSSNFNDWNVIWGNVSTTTDGMLEIKASETTNGGQVLLPHTSDWTNYKYTASVFVKQSSVTLISRYVDDNNFLACIFSGRYVEIIQRTNGQSRTVAYTTVVDAPYSSFYYNDITVSMRVDGKSVGCSMLGNEDNVTFNEVDSTLLKGGIGLQTWVSTAGIANLNLKKVQVNAI